MGTTLFTTIEGLSNLQRICLSSHKPLHTKHRSRTTIRKVFGLVIKPAAAVPTVLVPMSLILLVRDMDNKLLLANFLPRQRSDLNLELTPRPLYYELLRIVHFY